MANTIKGNQLLRDLGLNKFKYVWIQKLLDVPIDMYIVSVDSRYPETYFSISKLKKISSLLLKKIRSLPDEFTFKNLKLTPPIPLGEFSGSISSRAVIIRHDIAGEYFSDKKMFDKVNESFQKTGIKIY